jgi:hypothetical protein
MATETPSFKPTRIFVHLEDGARRPRRVHSGALA